MDEGFKMLEPQAASSFLYSFPAAAKREGEAWFRGGRVSELVPREPGRRYSALVQDGEPCEVELSYHAAAGWRGVCSRDEQGNCGHVFAAMNALLAENRSATVRGLSAGQARPQLSGGDGLAGRLAGAVGRSLTQTEKVFLSRIHTVYCRCRQRRQLAYADLLQMGLPPFGRHWEALEPWPAFPESEYEFWLYLAHAVQEHGLRVPELMAPITDLSVIEPKLARWQREREISDWKRALAEFQLDAAPVTALAFGHIDLRLAIHPQEARLEWCRPNQSAFEPLKQNDVSRFAADPEEEVLLGPEAELLWKVLSQSYYGLRVRFSLGEPETVRLLRHVLRLPVLESRIVNAQGEPLARPPQPLRWELSPAATAQEDYRLRLVQANGSPVPPFLATMPGHPTLFLTANALFTGPGPVTDLLDPARENRIPAPALEQVAGVALLQSLGLEMPPRLRERVRTLRYDLSIAAALQKPDYGNIEECLVTLIAEAPDGHQQTWTGSHWEDTTPGRARRRTREEAQLPFDDEPLVVYDTANLGQAAALLDPLRLKPGFYGFGLATKVTRKFPELFAAWLKTIPPGITVQLKGELASFATGDVAGRVRLDVTEAEIDWFDLRVVLDVQDTTLSAPELKLLLNAKGRYVRLAGKGWRRLHYELSDDENERLARLGLSPKELSAEPQRLHALQLADEAAKKLLPEAQFEQVQRRAEELKARVAPSLPTGITAQLRPYQVEGFHFLAYLSTNRFGGILADDMGLGKTLQTLAWIIWLRTAENNLLSPALSSKGGEGEVGTPVGEQRTVSQEQSEAAPAQVSSRGAAPLPSLVVCPKSVTDNWHAEALRFAPNLRVRVWSSGELQGFGQGLDTADVHVLNYSQLRSLAQPLATVRWLAVILDEGQYIKNPTSQTAQVARSLRTSHRLILTGTPIENRLLDLWSLMAFAMPGVLSNRAQFSRLYNAKDDPMARRRLSARVRPFVLRRTKGQVARDLPERIEEELFCEIEGEQKDLYRAELKRAQQLLLGINSQKELAQQQFHLLTSMLRLRQICCHPRLMKPDSTAPSAKVEALLEQLEPLMEEGQKVLVFSQFVELLDLLKPLMEERQWPHFYLAGQTENRGELVRQFQQTEGPAVFLISLKAGGFGLNLTAASYVVLFDPWWNPAVEAQAIDRTHRIGQVNKIIAYRLLIKDSIEGKIRALQKQKKALADDVLGEAKFSQSLTLDDLRFLFAD